MVHAVSDGGVSPLIPGEPDSRFTPEAGASTAENSVPGADLSGHSLRSHGRSVESSGRVIRQLLYNRLQDVRDLLHHGTRLNQQVTVAPFVFHSPSGGVTIAPCAGIDGFLHSETRFRQVNGAEASAELLKHYSQYIDTLLSPVSWTFQVRKELKDIASASSPSMEKFSRFFETLREFKDYLDQETLQLDKSLWVKNERLYQLFIRAYNLNERRASSDLPPHGNSESFFTAFDASDCKTITSMGFTGLWAMGSYPRGHTNAKGTADGSPYSVNMHEIDPALGSAEQVRTHSDLCRSQGLRVTFDLILNHTSLNSRLLESNPSLFVHRRTAPADSRGYYKHFDERHGEYWIRYGGCWNDATQSVAAWTDTLQLDLSNPRTRDVLIKETLAIVEQYRPDCFRVDMAYQLLNTFIKKNWGKELNYPLPEREFLEELITAVKTEFPGTAFIAEGYSDWNTISRCGFDLIYGLNHMPLSGGAFHHGWYESLKSKDPGIIQNAIVRSSFLQNQVGGAGQLHFTGQHDLPSPWQGLGSFATGGTFLTLMQPGPVLFYAGTENGFEKPCPEDGKMITFNEPAEIDWKSGPNEWSTFIKKCFEKQQEIKQELGEYTMEVFQNDQIFPLAGYLLKSLDSDRVAVVLANPLDIEISKSIEAPEHGMSPVPVKLDAGQCLVKFVNLNQLPTA